MGFQVKKWNLEAAWTEADLQAQLDVVQEAKEKKDQLRAKAEKACWKKTDDKVAGSLPTKGFWDHPMMANKISCVREGKTKCTGISCYSAQNMFTMAMYDSANSMVPMTRCKTQLI